jgi:phosphatidate cytidylyltransferase
VAIGVGFGIAAVALILMSLGPGWVVALVVAVLTLCAVELFTALRQGGFSPPVLLGLVAVAALPWAAFARGEGAIPLVLFLFVAFGMVWYLAGVGRTRPVQSLGVTALAVLWVGVLGSFAGLILRIGPVGGTEVDQGVSLLLLAVIAAVFHDVGGFAVGSRFGRTPFSPISPNKTLEGLGGAVGVALLAVLITRYLFGITDLGFAATLGFGLACAVAAVLGDLAESLVKRDLGIKDMGTILPGHGGIMDRFDTLLFVLPTAYYVIRFVYVG